ncbi:extracellular solute-binding protein [Nocardioides panacisoli]|uniref:extracellular solute-binding protein n=1 Tax=Nocardioides panacisoli TaxID=627624 RepID=UPI001C638F03|nr:extracellular solute-binding protein [Nocardioides panacisoli]QYJ03528.1 extracellular solute-binding protein [Nocardioides panacisoli]
MKTTTHRGRTACGISLLIALSLVVTACGSDSDSAAGEDELTFVNYGGDGMDAAKAGWLEPYTDETGVTFETDAPSDQAKIKAMVTSGKVTWDVVDIDAASAGPECGTLYEERPSSLDTSELMTDMISDDCMIPIIGQTVALVYNTELYGDNPPTSITDFFNRDFEGQRIIFDYWTGSAEPLALAAGVPADEVYPIDWNRLDSAVSSLGSNLTFQSTLDQAVQSMESGNFGMCLCYTGRTALAAQNGANVDVVWDKVWYGWDGLYVVKDSPNADLGWDFVQTLATSEGQSGYYEQLPYDATTTGEPSGEVPEEFKPFKLSFNEDQVQETVLFDPEFWSEMGATAADEWTALTSG